MRRVWVVLALVMLAGLPAAAQPFGEGIGDALVPLAGNPGYDVQHYDLDLTVASISTGSIRAVMTIDLIPTSNLSHFFLDFEMLPIASISVDAQPAAFHHLDGELEITPAQPLQANETATVVIRYAGTPEPVINPALGEGGWQTYREGIYVAGEPFSASSFMPVNDHPRDKATYTFALTVPEPWTAVSNGVLTSTVEQGKAVTYTWDMAQPMASYLVTLSIGHYSIYQQTGPDGLPIVNYLPSSRARELRPRFQSQPNMIAYFSELFGPYPFDTYGALVITDSRMHYALETQSRSTFGLGILSSGGDLVIAHELAHQWFGDSVSVNSWGDIWLNEGFARYAEVLWLEHTRGDRVRDNYLRQLYRTSRRSAVLPGSPSVNNLFSGAVYDRGALTLHALRHEVGDETFFEILRTYADRFRYGNAATADFIAVAEEVSGMTLDDLFDAWLFGEEVPTLQSIGVWLN
ncbi:MAG: M1 family metallopeptidase [Anaerolineae bacterium]|nr:M1 family metallopeptidase [Anaerolineae bacterium]